MPELTFRITGVEPAASGITPLLHFKLEVTNRPEAETIQTVLLQTQIQLQPPLRNYTTQEKEKLVDLFGEPERWGQTLRNRLWTQVQTTVRSFSGQTETIIPVPCTFDLNVASAKYFYALEEGDVSLLFLFSGTAFYVAPDGRTQVQPVPWDRECTYRMPVAVWRDLIEMHYSGSAWISLRRDTFEKLYAFKREHGIPTWEETIERLLPEEQPAGAHKFGNLRLGNGSK